MKKVGILIEMDRGRIKTANCGVITLARSKDTELYAFIMDAEAKAVKADLEAFGVSKIVEVVLAADRRDNPDVRAKAMAKAITALKVETVLGLTTALGKDLLPRIAALLEAPLVMDCIDVDLDGNMAKTSWYSGKTMATLRLTGKISFFGVRPNSVEPVKARDTAEILSFDATHINSTAFKVLQNTEPEKHDRISLTEANIIVAGGRGMKNGENFKLLSRCAEALNAAVGASRVAVDAGWVPYAMQVGQTGEKVSPRVYIACGISGSVQHFAGMKTAGMVIAVNLDENAGIMSRCDYFAVADALEVIPELTNYLENS
jgi:electron transfer flavoprotein alpha subunit